MKTVTRTQFRECITRSDIFFVEIHCNSMSRAGIRAGDLVVVDRETVLKPGDLVLGSIEGAWVIRRITKLDGRMYLESDAEKRVLEEGFLGVGKVVMVVRGV